MKRISARLKLLSVLALLALELQCGGQVATESSSEGHPPVGAGGSTFAVDATVSPADVSIPPMDSATLESASPEVDAPLDPLQECTKSDECVLVPHGACCAPCEPISIEVFSAVNFKNREEWLARQGCAGVNCAPCKAPNPRLVHVAPNFLAMCDEGRCVAVDLRHSKFSECASNADCKLQYGTGCCGGCGDSDLVVINPAAGLLEKLCPVATPCPPPDPACLGYRDLTRSGECSKPQCQLAD